MILPVILCGGSGTRLWPLSRKMYPKQLLALTGEQTLPQQTACRLAGMEGVSAPLVICNEEHRFLVAEQLREAGIKPEAIILEPVGRNTAPAVAISDPDFGQLLTKDTPPLMNISAGEDHTILALTESAQSVVCFAEAITFGAAKPDGTPRKLMDVSRLHKLGWRSKTKLDDGLRLANHDFKEMTR